MKRLPLLLLAPVLFSACASAPPTFPGHYADWGDGELEKVEIIQQFHLRDYHKIVVLPVDTGGLFVTQDNTRIPVEKNIAHAPQIIADQIDSDLPNRLHVVAEPGPANFPKSPGVLLLRAKFVELNPGSAAARIYTQGFAGATQITLAGEFVDSATGKVLVTFQHHNYHSKGGLFNRYGAALEENEEQIADSLASYSKRFTHKAPARRCISPGLSWSASWVRGYSLTLVTAPNCET